MKPGFFLWLVTILSFIWGVTFSFIAYYAAVDSGSSDKDIIPAIGADLWSIMGFVVCGICLIIRGFQVL